MSSPEAAEALYLQTPGAIRQRCGALFELARAGGLRHFRLDEARLPELAQRVVAVTRAAYPDVMRIPYHSRWRHFGAGGVDRAAEFEARFAERSEAERLMLRTELVLTSVLLDAGAGAGWSYLGSDGKRYTRSEGLAVASFDWFMAQGGALELEHVDAGSLGAAFQVSGENPLVGLEGRAALLRRLGQVLRAQPRYFGSGARLGELGAYLAAQAVDGALPARTVLAVVLDALGPIWPEREVLGGVALGDVWPHPAVGRVPFHKLSQWLSYSLCETLELSGVRSVDLDELTGLAEYRNGGLFVDGGVLVPQGDALLDRAHDVGSEVVVEWRALTVALLDRIADEVRALLGLSRAELPLARVLEGGTWATGRALAFAERRDGAPPLRVNSDGTVF
jgi:hypothetical protein